MNLDDFQKYLRDPLVLAGAGAALVLLVVVVVLVRRGGKAKGPKVDEKAARARHRLRNDLRTFRDDLKKASDGAAPVFKKIATETEFAQVIGHWRKGMNHRIAVRTPDLGALKGVARSLGFDAMPLSDLEAAWRKTERRIEEYNAGKLDASTTPIVTAKEFEKELQKAVVLANMCLTAFEG